MYELSLLQRSSTIGIAICIFVLIVISYLLGHNIRLKRIKKDPELSTIQLDTLTGTLFALLGLLLAFTFSMSNSRYDKRRDLVLEEVNDIGTAILRCDLYPDSIRTLLRANFKMYVDARVNFYLAGTDYERVISYHQEAESIAKEIWKITATDARENAVMVRSAQMIPALNAMIDITTTRIAAGIATVPDPIIYFLFILCLCASFLMGYDNKTLKTDWVVVFGLAIMLSLTIYNIIDLDRARGGLINLDTQNKMMMDLQGMFK